MKQITLLILIILFPMITDADTIILKNGKKINAIEAWEENGQIKCKIDLNTRIGIPKENVERIEKGEMKDDPEKIRVDFFETDIRKVFRLIKKASGKNFAIDKDVSGKVTLTLENPIPWEEVLDKILQMNQLGKEYFGDNTIRIFNVKKSDNAP